jgi:uncharacterized protein YndB with AHSA1/START domain
MPGFRETVVCDAPAIEVWRLVHDPERLPEWMSDTERVEPADDGTVTRYLHGWPDDPMPTRLRSHADGARVVISCLVSDIEMTMSLAPHPRGCAVELEVSLPEGESARLEGMRRLAADSLARLAARASDAAVERRRG